MRVFFPSDCRPLSYIPLIPLDISSTLRIEILRKLTSRGIDYRDLAYTYKWLCFLFYL